jgi:molybdate transport system ATP-binding protein
MTSTMLQAQNDFPRTSSSEATLSIKIRKHYSSHSGFKLETEFTAAPGVTVIVGHSGAGKTTLLRCVAGLCDPEDGRIAIGDRVLFDFKERIRIEPAKRRVGYVFQDLALFPHLTVRENVMYGLRRLTREERERRTGDILQSFQIEHLCERRPKEISGGEQQRVALARSLVIGPEALLLDEPLSSLDLRTKESIIEDLREWNRAHGIPILYVTHDRGELLALGDRVISLDRGRVIAEGSPAQVVAGMSRMTVAQPSTFQNLFDAAVVSHRNTEGTTVCQLSGSSLRIETPRVQLPVGSKVRIGIRAADVVIAASQPITGVLQRLLVFICSGNTSRSPLAQAICNAEIARRLKIPLECLGEIGVRAVSAGLSAESGAPMTREAQKALQEAGFPIPAHAARNLDSELASSAELILCMTESQQQIAASKFPDAANKIVCLHAEGDIDDPTGKGPAAFTSLVAMLKDLVAARLDVLGIQEVA